MRGENAVKEDEKKPLSWEVADPKPPVIQSGRALPFPVLCMKATQRQIAKLEVIDFFVRYI